VKLVSINTEQDSTLLFDFLPINLGLVDGFKIRIQGFTVPGQPKYRVMRKYVLSGADAVVLVVDSQRKRLEENQKTIEDLRANLRLNGLDPDQIPLVYQYNKRDLADVISEEELDSALKFRDVKAFPSVATENQGVFEAFCHAVRLLVERKIQQYGLGKGNVSAPDVAEAAVQRLLRVHLDTERLMRDSDGLAPVDMVSLQIPEPDVRELAPLPELVIEESAAGEGAEVGDVAADVAPAVVPDVALDVTLDSAAPDGVADGSGDVAPDVAPGALDTGAPAVAAAPVPVAEDAAAAPAAEDVGPMGLMGAGRADHDGDDAASAAERAASAAQEVADTVVLGQAVSSNMELARLYAELAEYKNLLERKNRELVEINQIISHDLKKPLTVIKTVVSLFDRGLLGKLEENQREAIRNALEGVAYMEDLISDIIESSRLDYDGLEMSFEEVEVAALVEEILHRLRYLLKEQGVRVEVGQLRPVHADPSALTKIFMNLIGNSTNYREPSRECVIKVGCRQEEDATVFSVEDNGIGIPDADAGTVFRKFKRGSNTCSVTGTGLGLYIVRELVLAHGGKIWFHSEVGKGTTFYVRLPRAPVQPSHSRTSTVEEGEG
jgi:signal transduction histidine kinase